MFLGNEKETMSPPTKKKNLFLVNLVRLPLSFLCFILALALSNLIGRIRFLVEFSYGVRINYLVFVTLGASVIMITKLCIKRARIIILEQKEGRETHTIRGEGEDTQDLRRFVWENKGYMVNCYYAPAESEGSLLRFPSCYCDCTNGYRRGCHCHC